MKMFNVVRGTWNTFGATLSAMHQTRSNPRATLACAYAAANWNELNPAREWSWRRGPRGGESGWGEFQVGAGEEEEQGEEEDAGPSGTLCVSRNGWGKRELGCEYLRSWVPSVWRLTGFDFRRTPYNNQSVELLHFERFIISSLVVTLIELELRNRRTRIDGWKFLFLSFLIQRDDDSVVHKSIGVDACLWIEYKWKRSTGF